MTVRTCLRFFFFNDTATTEIYTLSLHDALPIFLLLSTCLAVSTAMMPQTKNGGISAQMLEKIDRAQDRKSTRLNSSHANISYAVFCLKKNTTPSNTLCLSTSPLKS